MNAFQEVGFNILLQVIALPMWYLIIQNWIVSRMKLEHEKELEEYRTVLQKEYGERIEKLKSDLTKEQHRHSVVFKQTAELTVASHRLLLLYRRAAEVLTEI